MGVDFLVKTVKIPDRDSVGVELYLFDTSGHAIYKDLRATYWTGTQLIMAVYDVTNRNSFENLTNWVNEVSKCASKKGAGAMHGILVATKMDQSEFAQVTNQEALAFAHAHGLAFFETSAAQGKDVDVPFNFLAAKYHEYYEAKLKEVTEAID